MSIIVSECTFCMHCENEKDPENLKCKAYPEGIPSNLVWGFIDVHELDECNNGYKYEDYSK